MMLVDKNGENRWCLSCDNVQIEFAATKRTIEALRNLERMVSACLDAATLSSTTKDYLDVLRKAELFLHPQRNAYLIHGYEDMFRRLYSQLLVGEMDDIALA